MKKPEHKDIVIEARKSGSKYGKQSELDFGAGAEWMEEKLDAYWQEKIKTEYVRKDGLPSVEEIAVIVDKETSEWEKNKRGFVAPYTLIATTIHKRMTGGKG